MKPPGDRTCRSSSESTGWAVLAFFIAFVVLTVVPSRSWAGQEKHELNQVVAERISGNTVKELVRSISPMLIPVSFGVALKSPVKIMGAAGSCFCGQPQESAQKKSAICALDLKVNLLNQTERAISGLKLQFKDPTRGMEFDLSKSIVIEPYGSALFGESRDELPDLISLSICPQQLNVHVKEIVFNDGTIWEDDAPDADKLPVPVTRLQTKYTDEALRNRIQGRVRLRLLVGIDGTVKQVKIVRPLPDGLTEQALQQAYGLKFKPAEKNGEPVPIWVLYEVEFNIRKDSSEK